MESLAVTAEAGEAAIAVEDLVSNLYEFGVRLRADEIDALSKLADGLALPPDRWDFIRSLGSA